MSVANSDIKERWKITKKNKTTELPIYCDLIKFWVVPFKWNEDLPKWVFNKVEKKFARKRKEPKINRIQTNFTNRSETKLKKFPNVICISSYLQKKNLKHEF